MSDDVSKALVVLGLSKKAIERITDFIDRIAGPSTDELGLYFQDRVRMFRLANQIRMLKKAQKMLEDANITPTTVQLKILLPLLEGVGLEEDEDMCEKWAALLANATNPDSTVPISPSLPRILEQLEPREAKMLDFLFDATASGKIEFGKTGQRAARREVILDRMGISMEEYESITDNLVRLNLIYGRAMRLNFITHKDALFEVRDRDQVSLTRLGYHLVRACKAPPVMRNRNGESE